MQLSIFLRSNANESKWHAKTVYVTGSDRRNVRSKEEGDLFSKCWLGSRNVRLVDVYFEDSASRLWQMNFSQVGVRYAIVTIRPIAPSVFDYQRISFRLKYAYACRQSSERTNSCNLVNFRRAFLCVSTREDVGTNVYRLVLVVFVFNYSLFRSVSDLIVNVKYNSILFVRDRSPFHFNLCLAMFDFHDIRLCLVIDQVRFNRRLPHSCLHPIFRMCFVSDTACPGEGAGILDNFCSPQGL